MSDTAMKCVMIIDSELPAGIVANTAAILGITLGKHIPEQIGGDVTDASGLSHMGIITTPVVMLRGSKAVLKDLRQRLYGPEFNDVIVADFSDIAQSCNIYSDYIAKAAATTEQDHTYFGIALYGDRKKINKLTGSMPLLR